jgi:hypothetical protein
VRRPLAAAALLLAAVAPSGLTAQTRLRDPQQSVFALFPAADGYQAIVRTIDPAARGRVEDRLPFPVHINELGEHAVYVALRDRVPLGIVYVLCEEEKFGLTEVRWAITLDMRLAGFEFQRTRSRHRETVEASEFARLLHGRGTDDLGAMLKPDGSLKPDVRGVPAGADELAAALTRSALKAVTVVDEVWMAEVIKLHDLAVGTRAFPSAMRFSRIWPPGRGADADPDAAVSTRIAYVVRAIGRDGRPLGVVASVRTSSPDETLLWTVDAAGRVAALDAGKQAPPLLRSECLEGVGRELHVVARGDGEVARCAQALDELLHPAARPAR